MAASAPDEAAPPVTPRRPRRRRRLRTALWILASILAVAVLLPLLLAVGILLWADTHAGRTWVAAQIAAATAGGDTRVEIGDIDPGLPGRFAVRDVTVSDDAGVWLTMDAAELDWNPWQLMNAVLRIDSLQAQGVQVARLPESDAPAEASVRFDPERLLPDLPLALSVGSIDLRDIALAAPVAGEAAVLDAQAKVALTPDEGARLVLNVQRTDGTPGQLSVEAEIARADGVDRLALQAQLQEPPGGLIAAIAGWPDSVPVSLEVTGQGPLDALQGRIAAGVGGLATVEGSYRALYGVDDGSLTLGAELQGDVTGLLPAELRPLAAGRVGLSFEAKASGDASAIAVDSLSLATPALALQGTGAVDLAADRLAADLAVDRLDAAALQGFVPGLELQAPHLTLHAEGGLAQPRLDLQLRAERLALPDLGLQGVALQAKAHPLGSLLEGPLPRIAVELQGRAEAVRAAALAEAGQLLQPGLSLQLAGNVDPQAGAVALDRARLELESLTLQAEGELAADGPLRLDAVVEAPDVAPLAGLLGMPLRGTDLHAALQVSGSDLLAAQPGAWDATLAVRLGEPGYGELPLQPLLGGELQLSAQLQGSGTDSLSVSQLDLQGQNLSAAGEGRLDLAQDRIAADLRLRFPDLSALSELAGVAMTGTATADVDVSGSLEAPQLRAELALADAVIAGSPVRQAQVTARLDPLSEPLKVALQAKGEAMNLPLQLSTDLVLETDGGVSLGAVKADIAGTAIDGGLRIDPADGQAKGVLKLSSADLAPLAGRFGVALKGAASGTVTLAPSPAGQGVKAELQIARLEEPDAGLAAESARLQADLVLAAGGPRGTLDLALQEVALGATGFERLTLRGEGDLATGMQLALQGKGQVEVAGEARPLALSARAAVQGLPPDLVAQLSDLRLTIADKTLQQQGTATIAMKGDATTLRDLRIAVEGGGSLAARVAVGAQAIELELRADGVPLALAGLVMEEVPVTGTAALSADLSLRPGQPEGEAVLTLTEVRSTRPDLATLPDSSLRLEARLNGGRLRAQAQWEALGSDPGRFELSMPLRTPPGELVPEPSPNAPLDGSLAWSGSLDQMELFLPGVDSDISGRFQADLTIAGTPDDPRAPGQVTISDGSYRNYTTGTIVADIEARIDGGEDGHLEIVGRATDGAAGRIAIGGSIDLGAEPLPTFAVDLDASSFVAARLELATGRISADLKASGNPLRNRVEGTVVVDALDVQIGGGLPPSATVIPVTVVPRPGAPPLNPPQEDKPAQPSRTRLDIAITIPPRMTVGGRGLDSTWSGSLQVAGSTANPRITGQITAVRGSFTLVGRRFVMEEGVIAFSGGTPPNPSLNIVLSYTGEQATANVVISGTAADPNLNLTSNPPMPESDIISAVLFNRRSTQLSPAEALEVASSLAALTGRGNPGADITSKVRQALGLDVLNVGSDASGQPTLDAGRYVTDDVYVGVRQGLKADSSSVAVEVDLTDNIQLETNVGVDSRSSVGINWKFDY